MVLLCSCSSPKEAEKQKGSVEVIAPIPIKIPFGLDDLPGSIFIPRPAKMEGLEISSFVAKRAKSIDTWKALELVLADGTIHTVTSFASGAGFYLMQHEGRGIDFLELDATGNQKTRIGPLRGLQIITKQFEPPLSLSVLGEKKTIEKKELSKLPLRNMGPGNRKSWSLLDFVELHAELSSIKRIVIEGRSRLEVSFVELQDKSRFFGLRYNDRGELRFKTFVDEKVLPGSGVRDVRSIQVIGK